MDAVLFGMVMSPVEMADSVKVYGGKLDMAGAWLDRLKQLLAPAVLTLPEILADPVLKDCPRQDLIDAVKLLTIGGHISPFARRALTPPDEGAERTRVVPRLNRLLLDRPHGKSPRIVLASPVVGSGIVLNALEAVLLAGLETDDPLHWIASELRRRDVKLTADDKVLEDEKETRDGIRRSLEAFQTHKLPKLACLGVVEAA